MPQQFNHALACADAIIAQVGPRIVLGIPLGLGKPNQLVNALVQRACENPDLDLLICTALSLTPPTPGSAMERRFLDPIIKRLWGDYPRLDYLRLQRENRLPANIRIREFFLRTGAYLGNPSAQQSYVSANYTHAVRDLEALQVNVIAQLVAPAADQGTFSLSCNPDISLELLPGLQARRARGDKLLLVGQVNQALPYMPGPAALSVDAFDMLLADPELEFSLFPVPDAPLALRDHAIGLHAASLIKDGGTLQIGIGSLGDAVCHALALRQHENALFQRLCTQLQSGAPQPTCAAETAPFAVGLYGASEMLVPGFLALRQLDILKRSVTDPTDGAAIYLHAGFFLGPARFYQQLRDMPASERQGIRMCGIKFVNAIYGDEARKREQRVHARFINNAMMVSLLGAVVSDGLDDGRIVSGVGGQYNFVAMAHELADARSIILVPATREHQGKRTSNILWHYGHTTIPRHLRDMVVTEYGVADLRGRTDRDVIVAMLAITDTEFQDQLLAQAKAAGKIEADYQIPAWQRRNTPAWLQQQLLQDHAQAFPYFPFGTDFSPLDASLAVALIQLKRQRHSKLALLNLALTGRRVLTDWQEALARMALHQPKGLQQRMEAWLLAGALAQTQHPKRPLLGRWLPQDNASC